MTKASIHPRRLVLAWGNSLRGDDGIGLRIAEAIARDPSFAGVDLLVAHQLLPEHAEPVSKADAVVFLDCSVVSPPGEVSTAQLEPSGSLPRIFTHHFDPASLLKLTLELYGRIPELAVAVAVGGESFELQEQISDQVSAAIPAALTAIANLLR